MSRKRVGMLQAWKRGGEQAAEEPQSQTQQSHPPQQAPQRPPQQPILDYSDEQLVTKNLENLDNST